MAFSLIETLRFEPGKGFVRLRLHLGRMETSASELGFRFDRQATLSRMEAAVAGEGVLRVRVELARDGALDVATTPYVPPPADMVWRVAIASTRIDSRDELLRHRTTRRDVYANARSEFPADAADEVILLNEAGAVCEGTISTVFVARQPGEPLMTPPLSCGLLDGVLRREMLESGAAREATLSAADLAAASRMYCGNSLRGLIPAALA